MYKEGCRSGSTTSGVRRKHTRFHLQNNQWNFVFVKYSGRKWDSCNFVLYLGLQMTDVDLDSRITVLEENGQGIIM